MREFFLGQSTRVRGVLANCQKVDLGGHSEVEVRVGNGDGQGHNLNIAMVELSMIIVT